MQPIYMDNAATTRLDPLVLEAMMPYFTERYGNAASRVHRYGWEAEEAGEIARAQIASALGADPREIVITSGATESDNLALKGVMAAYRTRGRHLVTTAIEHPAVLDSAKALAAGGCEVTILPVDSEGRVDPRSVANALRKETVLVSIIHGNNETGVLQDLTAISEVCRAREVLLHTDATQTLGKLPLDVSALGCDLLSISAHKIYGPKGAGALFVRRRDPRVRLLAQMDGGGHERGLRSGTLNVPGLVGFGRACALAVERLGTDPSRIGSMRDRLETALLARLEGTVRNTPARERTPHVLNLSFRGLEGEALLLGLRKVALSSGSACASASLEPSHVLLALGRSPAEARSALRFSLGRFNTAEEVDIVIEEVCQLVGDLRALRQG
jgi:cysteine desulfurase